MTSHYCETYIVNDRAYSIEDLDDGQADHYMPEFNRPRGRYMLWYNGYCVGHEDTIDDARKKLAEYIRSKMKYRKDLLFAELVKVGGAFMRLQESSDNLQLFLQEEE